MSNPYRPRRLPSGVRHIERITVDEDHIGGGTPCSADDCAVALAVVEHFTKQFPGTHWIATVDNHTVVVLERDSGTDIWTYRHNAYNFIEAFDELAIVSAAAPTPGPFELELYA